MIIRHIGNTRILMSKSRGLYWTCKLTYFALNNVTPVNRYVCIHSLFSWAYHCHCSYYHHCHYCDYYHHYGSRVISSMTRIRYDELCIFSLYKRGHVPGKISGDFVHICGIIDTERNVHVCEWANEWVVLSFLYNLTHARLVLINVNWVRQILRDENSRVVIEISCDLLVALFFFLTSYEQKFNHYFC